MQANLIFYHWDEGLILYHDTRGVDPGGGGSRPTNEYIGGKHIVCPPPPPPIISTTWKIHNM